jgi:hypothetical protein
MTREEAKKWGKEIQAFAEGKTIQIHSHGPSWLDISDPSWNMDSEYRIKPESKREPFDSSDMRKSMSKIETPEEFVKRYAQEALSQNLYGLRVAVTARDEQYLALLKQCGEALADISKLRGEYAGAENPSAKGFFHMACDKADTALAALKDAGVINEGS